MQAQRFVSVIARRAPLQARSLVARPAIRSFVSSASRTYNLLLQWSYLESNATQAVIDFHQLAYLLSIGCDEKKPTKWDPKPGEQGSMKSFEGAHRHTSGYRGIIGWKKKY